METIFNERFLMIWYPCLRRTFSILKVLLQTEKEVTDELLIN